MKKIEEKTTGDMILDAILAALVPMAAFSVWFLLNVRWWA